MDRMGDKVSQIKSADPNIQEKSRGVEQEGQEKVVEVAAEGSGPVMLATLLREKGWKLDMRCGGRGLCRGCLVELIQGRLVPVSGKDQGLSAEGKPVLVQACQWQVEAGQRLRLRIPAGSLLAHEPMVLGAFRVNVRFGHDPLIGKQEGSGTRDAVGELGAAVDVGTTTVAVALVDLTNGKIVGQAAGYNRQMELGDDVITRIHRCASEAGMIRRFQELLIRETLEPLLKEALAKAYGKTKARCVAGLVAVGNTTMLHLLAGEDPSSIGVAPFRARFLGHRVLRLGELGWPEQQGVSAGMIRPEVPVHLLPGAAAYIGADVVAGAVASGLVYENEPAMLVDVGTNGEILLKDGPRIWGCATAAGPAFEGVRLSSGMRAVRGAISRVKLARDGRPAEVKVIGGGKAIGVCGSGYIDFLAEGRRTGLLMREGRFEPEAINRIRDQFVQVDREGWVYRMAEGAEGREILISEADIAALLQAKAAIAAGILILLEKAGRRPEEIRKLYLAGGFGTYMDHEAAIACGLLPGFRREQVQVVGNSALAGAYLALVDRSAAEEMEAVAQQIEVVELNQVPGFEERYIEQLMLP